MLYVVYGTDSEKARARARALTRALQEKKPSASFFRLTAEDAPPERLRALVEEQGLFEPKHIVFLDGVFENKEAREELLERAPALASSPHAFVLLARELSKAAAAAFEKAAARAERFDKSAPGDRPPFPVFSLGDFFGRRDRRGLWALYVRARRAGISPEEVNGILFWQAKSMRCAAGMPSAEKAGLSPFVFRKSRGFAEHFSAAELDSYLWMFLELFHEAHRGRREFETGLERLILSL